MQLIDVGGGSYVSAGRIALVIYLTGRIIVTKAFLYLAKCQSNCF